MDKVKVGILVKGNIYSRGDIAVNNDLIALEGKPIPDKCDLSNATIIHGDLIFKDSVAITNGVVVVTGDAIINWIPTTE